MEGRVEQADLLQRDLRSLHPPRALILVKLHLQITSHLVAGYQLALHAMFDREFGVAADEAQNLIHRAEELLRLLLRHRSLACRRRSALPTTLWSCLSHTTSRLQREPCHYHR